MLVPKRCNHYHIRMRVSNSNADMWLDDFRINKLVRRSSTPAEIEAKMVCYDDNKTLFHDFANIFFPRFSPRLKVFRAL